MNPFNKLYKRTSTRIPRVPRYLDIELTNHCNLKCKMCGTNYSKREKGFMTKKTLNKILDFVAEYNTPVRIIGWGEPTLHPKYNSFIGEINYYVPVHVNTNGHRYIEGVESKKYSFHNDDNIRNILKYNDTLDQNVTYSLTDLENKEITILGYMTGLKINKTDTRWIDGKDRSTKRFKRCGEVFDKLTIFWNGDITACCGDVEGKLILGNINKDDIIDIWKNNKLLNHLREELRKKNWKVNPLCERCFDYEI